MSASPLRCEVARLRRTRRASRRAIYPGSFDPVTYGHIDVIERAAHVFDEVIVAVANNIQKKPLFDTRERVAMLLESTKSIKGIRIDVFDGLVIDFAHKNNANVLIRGLRMVSDFEYEFQMALTNRRLAEDIETVFLMPSEGYSFLSSTLIKEAVSLGADVSSFVPEDVAKRLKKRLSSRRRQGA
ncbi:MAG: pantetheine-phosphate adenylyltransferase [Omnitrophica WOR_2 bacterium RIFCSPHIGHO2_02_FULL_50_17]|nr:MAG: pantetheine-phosphate adenylyltransferase [Omnitrophica WOR_2 bacterium RIFCSPHIGHO2_02_FULL_50_17]